jgi:predicted transcriptional regulator
LRYTFFMKTASLPSIRVDPELRAQLESVLGDDETLTEFVEGAVRAAVERRRVEAEFQARGESAWQDFKRTGVSYSTEEVFADLRTRLADRRQRLSKGQGG